MVRRTTKKGGFLGLATAAALRYGVPLAVKYLRSRGKKSRKGKGMKQLGTSKCNCKHGKGMRQLGRGKRGGNFWNNIKKAASKLYQTPEVQALVRKGKDYAKRNIKYAITHPVQSYKNVKKFFGDGTKHRTIKVAGYGYKGKMPPKAASVSGVHSMAGPALVTMSKRKGPGHHAKPAPNSVVRRQARRVI